MVNFFEFYKVITFTIIAVLLTPICETLNNGVEDEQYLKEKLQKVLPQHFPPYDMLNRTVYIYNDLLQIVNVDEKRGLWEVKLWIFLSYQSDQAKDAWTGKERLPQAMLFPQGTFWTPDIIVYEAIDLVYDAFTRQVVYSDGFVYAWASLATFKLSCQFDVTDFPEDQQLCEVKFRQFLLHDHHYTLDLDNYYQDSDDNSSSIEMPLIFYIPNDQWRLLGNPVFTIGNGSWHGHMFDEVKVTIRLQRRSRFYTVALISPFIVLYTLSAVIFLIPVESGEKISFGVTILLAQMVFFSILMQILPASSRNLPLAFEAMRLACAHLAWTVAAAVIVVRVHNTGSERKIWKWLRNFLSTKAVCVIGLKQLPPATHFITPSSSENQFNPIVKNKNNESYPTEINIENLDARQSENQANNGNGASHDMVSLEWIYLARFLDRVFFIIHWIMWFYHTFGTG